ncbi:MAG: endonuclease dU, partial [Candidatus Thorarchaeota archaeon]
SESFQKTDQKSTVAGVIMRGDFRIDGFGFCSPTVGGMDATDHLISMFQEIERNDIRFWLLSGSIISWFNIVDIKKLHKTTDTPVISVSYSESEGLERYVKEYFPEDGDARMEKINQLGMRHKVLLENGYELFLVTEGMDVNSAKELVNRFTIDGRVPEPIRIARSLAASLRISIDETP